MAGLQLQSLGPEIGETVHPAVTVEGPVSPDYLAELSMNGGLANFRLPERQKTALIEIAGLDQGLVFIGRSGEEIVGYLTILRPDPFTRWLRHTRVLELGAIEVSPRWRRSRIGSALLIYAFSRPSLENYIVVTTEYCWHWDLPGTGLDIWEYRDMLTRLFGQAGLVVKPTDDPDITEHPANVLMARVGTNVSLADEVAFEALLFRNPAGVRCG